MTITDDLKWLRTHLILLVLVVGLAFGGVYSVESVVAKHDEATSSKYELILQQQEKQTAALEANWQAVQAQLIAQNAQLSQAITSANKNLAVQIQKNATLTAQEAASQIATTTQGTASASGNNVVLDLLTARKVSDALVTLPVVQTELVDTTQQLKNTQTILTNTQADVVQQKELVKAEVDSCSAQIKVIKVHQRKNILKALGIGYVAGLLTKRLALGAW